MSGKPRRPGRPREDRFLRRMQIFEAVAPLLAERGARGITMRDAAEAAHLSLGGLHHYFATKRELVLFPLLPGVCDEVMRRFEQRWGHLWPDDPDRYLEEMIDTSVWTILRLRPAVQAALELGAGDAWRTLEESMTADMDGFVALARQVRPAAAAHDPDALARAIQRQLFAGLLDRSVTAEELGATIRSLIDGTPLPGHRPRAGVLASTAGTI